MKVVSLKDYAAEKNISYEAVRQQVVRYKNELGSHVIKDGRQQFLDEEAVAFLDAKRQKNPVAIIQQDKNERIEELEDQVKQLLIKTAAQADRISELAQWKADNALAIAEAGQTKLLLDNTMAQIAKMEKEAVERIERARQEAVEATVDAMREETAREIDKVRKEALTAAKQALEDEKAQIITRAQSEIDAAKKTLEDENHLLRQKLEQVERKTRWQKFIDVFR